MTASFLDSLARPEAVPGGGAASAYGASVGLALLGKIVRLELRRNATISESEAFWGGLLERCTRIAENLFELQEEDGRAYTLLAESKRIHGTDSEHFRRALRRATEVPLEIMTQAPPALACALEVGAKCKKHLLSDLLAAAEILRGGAMGASHIVEANLCLVVDQSVKDQCRFELSRIRSEIAEGMDKLRKLARPRESVHS